MFRFILYRLVGSINLLFIVITITFFLIHLAPGNPFANEHEFPPQIVESLNRQYGLDKPFFFFSVIKPNNSKLQTSTLKRLIFQWNGIDNQYWNYLKSLCRFDLGPSTRYEGQSVNKIIRENLANSIVLGIVSYLLALIVGLVSGVLAARTNIVWNYISLTIVIGGISIPSFVLGPILIMIFSLTLNWLPPARWGDFRHLILPTITLSAVYASFITKLVRSEMLEVLSSDYIRAAYAKGLTESAVIFRHALRIGLFPVISFTGPALAFLLGGTIVVEKIFAIPGLGSFFIDAAEARDYTLVIGITIITTIFLVTANFLVDLFYFIIDPRIRT